MWRRIESGFDTPDLPLALLGLPGKQLSDGRALGTGPCSHWGHHLQQSRALGEFPRDFFDAACVCFNNLMPWTPQGEDCRFVQVHPWSAHGTLMASPRGLTMGPWRCQSPITRSMSGLVHLLTLPCPERDVGATAIPNSRVNSLFSASIQTEQSLVCLVYLCAASWICS